jgi:hypothetical protein
VFFLNVTGTVRHHSSLAMVNSNSCDYAPNR